MRRETALGSMLGSVRCIANVQCGCRGGAIVLCGGWGILAYSRGEGDYICSLWERWGVGLVGGYL